MAYYTILDFRSEPFSNTPDPRLFYHTRQHLETLQKLEISIRLKRGLNLVMGDVGTGKTTLCRQLIRRLQDNGAVNHHLILDPGFESAREFLVHLNQLLTGRVPQNSENETQLKEGIKHYLFSRSVEGGNTVLLIDEGQKASLPILESLRELLNFETNDEKLLQIIIFAQNEFIGLLEQVKNFQDRINFQYCLTSLGFKEFKALIQYRLNRSFAPGKARPFFTGPAYWAIYRSTRGFPRQMVNLCHQVILTMIIQNKKKAGIFLVLSCIKKRGVPVKPSRGLGFALAGLIMAAFVSFFYAGHADWPWVKASPLNQPALPPGEPPEKISPEIPAPALPTPPDISPTEKPEMAPPHTASGYGKVIVPPDITLSRMIHRVYGRFSNKLVSEIMARNPGIKSPGRIWAGSELFFPVSEFAKPVPPSGLFPILMETRRFSRAFSKAMSREYTREVPVRIISHLLPDGEFIFHVVLNYSFDTPSQGLAFMEKKYPGFVLDSPLNFLDMTSLEPVIKGPTP